MTERDGKSEYNKRRDMDVKDNTQKEENLYREYKYIVDLTKPNEVHAREASADEQEEAEATNDDTKGDNGSSLAEKAGPKKKSLTPKATKELYEDRFQQLSAKKYKEEYYDKEVEYKYKGSTKSFPRLFREEKSVALKSLPTHEHLRHYEFCTKLLTEDESLLYTQTCDGKRSTGALNFPVRIQTV